MSALALRVLRALEWSHEHGACPSCRACRRCDEQDGRSFAGHRDDCELAAAIRELEAPACPACGGSRIIDAPIEYDVSGFPCSGPRPCETCRPDDVPSPEGPANG